MENATAMIHELGSHPSKRQLLPESNDIDAFIPNHWISHTNETLERVETFAFDVADIKYQSFNMNNSACIPPAQWINGMEMENLCFPDYTAFYACDDIAKQVQCLFQADIDTYGYSNDPLRLHEPGRYTIAEYLATVD